MRIELINWSGHDNIGDDAMADVLLEVFDDAVNKGEHPIEHADWYIMGGGTLIAPQSLFPGRTPNPERTIGVSLGVSSNWRGEWKDILVRFKKIYVRDYFSFTQLKRHGIEATLSVDLLCAMKSPKSKERKGTWLNLMVPQGDTSVRPMVNTLRQKYSKHKDVTFFSVCSKEDMETIPDSSLYLDAQELLKELVNVKQVFATRLHANVLAWVAGVPDIRPVVYDPKVTHFFERVSQLRPRAARKIMMDHLKEIEEIIYGHETNT